jgi:preprotein translocase subunit SecD
MLRFSTPKVLAIVATVLIGCLLAVPSLMTREQRTAIQQSIPGWVPSWIVPTRAMVLGLDLQGGSHVLLEVDVPDLVRTQATTLRDDVRRILRETRVAPQGGIQLVQRGVQLRVPDSADRAKLMPRLQELSQPISNAILGQTGDRDIVVTEQPDGLVQLAYSDAGVNERVRRAIDQAIEVLRRRVDALGTTEPNIQRQGATDPRAGARPPGPAAPEGHPRPHRQARVPHAAESPSGDVDMLPSRDTGGKRVPVERRIIVEAATSWTPSRPSTSAARSRSSTSASTSAAPSASARPPPRTSTARSPSCSTTR